MQISSECGEAFCSSCWDEYLSAKLTDQANIQMIQCPGCDIVMDDRAILKVLNKNSKLKVRYQQVLINSFVECNNLLKWCPSPNCENVIKVPHVEAKTVTCACGHSFCFVCIKDQHDPVRSSNSITVWKFKNFPATQILRDTNFDIRSKKKMHQIRFEGNKFWFLVNISPKTF